MHVSLPNLTIYMIVKVHHNSGSTGRVQTHKLPIAVTPRQCHLRVCKAYYSRYIPAQQIFCTGLKSVDFQNIFLIEINKNIIYLRFHINVTIFIYYFDSIPFFCLGPAGEIIRMTNSAFDWRKTVSDLY